MLLLYQIIENLVYFDKANTMSKKKKKVAPICRNCRLFDSANNLCNVKILYKGEKINLPVDPDDKCFYEQKFFYENNQGDLESFKPEVQQVKWWTEDPATGQKTDGDGRVKIEYPEGFFGDED